MTVDNHRALTDAVRTLQVEADFDQTMKQVIGLATSLISDCTFAGASCIGRDGSIETTSSNDPAAERCDELQVELGEGPSLEALFNQDVIYISDVATDERWPAWGRHVVETLKIRSMLCFQLFTNDSAHGVLTFYSREAQAFDHADRTACEVFSAHVAAVMAESQDQENLQTAIGNRTTIGQAQGILMERFDLNGTQAFEVLKRVSQGRNVKLLRVATDLVDTRLTPGVEPDPVEPDPVEPSPV